MRKRTHIARALHVVLAAQRINADARPADIAGRHREIGDGNDRGRSLAVLGNAEAVIDCAVPAGGIETRRAADRIGRDAGYLGDGLGAVAFIGGESGPVLELVPARSVRGRTAR